MTSGLSAFSPHRCHTELHWKSHLFSQDFFFLLWSTVSRSVVLILRSGLCLNVSLQYGQLQVWLLSQQLFRQVLQKLCPHGVLTGSVNTSRHIEHWSSVSGPLEDDMTRKRIYEDKSLTLFIWSLNTLETHTEFKFLVIFFPVLLIKNPMMHLMKLV